MVCSQALENGRKLDAMTKIAETKAIMALLAHFPPMALLMREGMLVITLPV